MGVAVVTALVTHEGGPIHEWAGYTALVAALMRLLTGLCGPHVARFSTFVKSPVDTWHYAKQAWHHTEPRHLNHNPLGAWMVLTLLATTVSAGAAGALYVTETYWGYEWLINLHAAASWSLVPLVLVHVAGVLHASWRHRENLAAAMIHGVKAARSKSDITKP